MSKRVERNGQRVRIFDDTNREIWNGRTDALPPQEIRYVEDGIRKAQRVDGATDAELIQALDRLLEWGKIG